MNNEATPEQLEATGVTPEPDTQYYIPELIFDAEQKHTHYYVERGTDIDGRMIVMCTKCPHGNMYDPTKQHLVDGVLVKTDETTII